MEAAVFSAGMGMGAATRAAAIAAMEAEVRAVKAAVIVRRAGKGDGTVPGVRNKS